MNPLDTEQAPKPDEPLGEYVCPRCWTPGTPPDPMWLDLRSKFCFACGTQLRHECVSCQQPITSLKHKFCPFCGTPYKAESSTPDAV
ncbi:MAG: zinc ribbon domain-containing protein [Leptolyngbya sp. SIO4C1]|nr:zinc ribbon domain-containing protein [Leptolyngbya sp. SIO4C1]